jgi:D-tyrosyl-tRNA(Tyr) deacylase
LRAVVQRVARARITVDGELVAAIRTGLVIYLGVAPNDDSVVAGHFAGRLAKLRIFPDGDGKMNRSLLDLAGEALVVSQFTLFADTRRGHRPEFTAAAGPDHARDLYRIFGEELRRVGVARVSQGKFGAHMLVDSVNDGPVTIVATSGESPWSADCG